MLNAITGWILGDPHQTRHLDPAEASALTITKQDMICIGKSVLVASAIMAIVMTPVVLNRTLSI